MVFGFILLERHKTHVLVLVILKGIGMTKKRASMQQLISNFKPVVRNDSMEGKNYLVVPMIMMTEGVHQGSSGPLYYPATELAKIPEVWNHKPIVVYHPQINGQGISACDPDILTNRKIGVIMKTKFEDNKLKAEAWLEADRAKTVDERIVNAIEEGKMLELSTGLYTDLKQEEGEWNGEAYTAIAINYRPDHLAVLPDQIGACSIKDGAGFFRMNAAQHQMTFDYSSLEEKQIAYITENLDSFSNDFTTWVGSYIETNELSHNEIWDKLRAAVSNGAPSDVFIYIEEVYDDYFVYSKEDKMYRQAYEIQKDVVKLSGMSEQVKKVVKYEPVTIINVRKDIPMDKTKMVDGLITNAATKWVEEDRETLMAMDEKVLEKLEPIANKAPEKKSETKKEEIAIPTANTEVKAETVDEYIAKAPKEMQSILRNSMQSYETEKSKLVGIITANKKNPFTEDQLKAKDIVELRQIATLAQDPAKKQEDVIPLFNGQGDPKMADNKVVPLDMPSFDEKVA